VNDVVVAYFNRVSTYDCRRPKVYGVTAKMHVTKKNLICEILNCVVSSYVGINKTCNSHAIT
jgi:hypothetical protein